MSCSDASKPFADSPESHLRSVTVFAQVSKVEMAEIFRDDLSGDFGGGFIGQMSVPAQNALFHTPRTLGVILEKLGVMIGFEDQDSGFADPLDDHLRGMAQICEKTNVISVCMEHKTHGILGIMWNGESIDRHFTDIEARACGEDAAVEL